MKEEAIKIAEEIKVLVDQLVEMTGEKTMIGKKFKHVRKENKTKGASGALKILINEGFFNKPKILAEIRDRMKEIGRYYSDQLIATTLLNLSKKRILNRFKDKDSGNWKYVLRK